jgi:putative tricarboxylic transport membrane protein
MMDLLHNLMLGLGVALSLQNLFFCLLGTLVGTLIGVLPGIGPTATIAMLLPITFTMPATASLIMLAGIYYGAQYGGSTTAILINLPGEASSAVTAIDGYQMARQGRAGPALGIAAIGSFFAGTVATFVIALFAVPLTQLALEFGSAEYFSLIVLGLVASVVLAHGSIIKALSMIVLGLLFGLVGTDQGTGTLRFTLGHLELADGLDFVAISVGIFGVAEILRNLEDESDRQAVDRKITGLMPTISDLKQSAFPIMRGTIIGSLLGILPGGGALLSSFAAYAVEKKISKDPQRFGKGAIEGVAAPESANNAGAQTSFIPMLTLGIPSNAVMALMVGAMIIKGVVPGPDVVTQKPELFWGLIASMWIGNGMLVLLNLPLIGIWVRLLTIPYYLLFPAIMAFSLIGVYTVAGNPFHIYEIAAFGLLGYIMVKLGCEPAPFLLGFILGPMLEEHFVRAMLISRGDLGIFVMHPLSAGLLGLAAVLLVFVSKPSVSKKREQVFVEET